MVVIPLFLKKGCRVFLRKTCIGWNSITLLLRHKILFGIRLIPIYIFSTEEAMSPDQHKIVVAFRLMNQMLFFDRKKLTSKWLTTSTELPLPHTTDGQHYSGVCCTDKTVLAFRAFPLHPDGRKRERNISVFDWNGKFKYLLNIEHPLKAPFFDAEKGFLYATDDEDRIRKYAVGEFL